jgi:alginate O-acetyltransferase complex protein AlgI
MHQLLSVLSNIFGYNQNNPISLISGYFLVFFTLFLFVYSMLYNKLELRKWTLIIFNFLFYYKLTGFLSFIILIPTIFDFFIARKMESSNELNKRILFFISICSSLALLIYFKYTNFFIEIINSFSRDSFSILKIIIPVGISFYIFRTISYIIDVYNEKIDAIEKFSDYLVYMTFFPLLISGPITRAEQFIPQLNQENNISSDKINNGLFLIIKGIIKKAIFADYLSYYVAMIFAAPTGYTGLENLVAIICFSIQLYLDFSGYTDMASGVANILGFDIGANFNEPFKAKNISDFWRRWHISLSDWLKDYIFSPLNFYFRKLKVYGAIIAMFITFFICGIWHGTTWIFILFGILHGSVLSIELATRNVFNFKEEGLKSKVYFSVSWLLTFSFIAITMLAMRLDSISTTWGVISKFWTNFGFENIHLFFEVQLAFTSMFTLALIFVFLPFKFKEKLKMYFLKSHLSFKILFIIVLVQIMVELQNQNIVPFIYAQY